MRTFVVGTLLSVILVMSITSIVTNALFINEFIKIYPAIQSIDFGSSSTLISLEPCRLEASDLGYLSNIQRVRSLYASALFDQFILPYILFGAYLTWIAAKDKNDILVNWVLLVVWYAVTLFVHPDPLPTMVVVCTRYENRFDLCYFNLPGPNECLWALKNFATDPRRVQYFWLQLLVHINNLYEVYCIVRRVRSAAKRWLDIVEIFHVI